MSMALFFLNFTLKSFRNLSRYKYEMRIPLGYYYFLMPIEIVFATRQIHFKFIWRKKASKRSQEHSEKRDSWGVEG